MQQYEVSRQTDRTGSVQLFLLQRFLYPDFKHFYWIIMTNPIFTSDVTPISIYRGYIRWTLMDHLQMVNEWDLPGMYTHVPFALT